MTEKKNFYITTPIYYVNDVPHIGHAYTSIACDTIARFKKLQGYNVHFLTGTDEHGQKVQKSALDRGKTPQQYCDEISTKFRELADLLKIEYDDFIRTTEDRHKKTVEIFWKKLQENGWIYKDIYEGWYSIRDEAFYGEDELINGKAPTGAEVVWQKEESYFFKLSEFQDKLLEICSHTDKIEDTDLKIGFVEPSIRRNEIVSFIKGGKEYQKGALKDLSISRTSFDWGIKVPNDEKHVIYVWLDALMNYLSALNFGGENDKLYQDFWNNKNVESVHIVGKDILRFHTVYWPAFLLAAKLPLPKMVVAHGWWTNEGQKISKSVGNVIDPIKELEWLESFNVSREIALDYFRYFLLKEVPFGSDGDYSRTHLINRINGELVNNIGNLLQRTAKSLHKDNEGELADYKDITNFHDIYCASGHAPSDVINEKNPINAQSLLKQSYELSYRLDKEYHKTKETIGIGFIRSMNDHFYFSDAIGYINSLSGKANSFINQNGHFSLVKFGHAEQAQQILSIIIEVVRCLAIALQPFCINGSEKILDLLNIPQDQRNIEHISGKYQLKAGHKINAPEIVFPRLNVK